MAAQKTHIKIYSCFLVMILFLFRNSISLCVYIYGLHKISPQEISRHKIALFLCSYVVSVCSSLRSRGILDLRPGGSREVLVSVCEFFFSGKFSCGHIFCGDISGHRIYDRYVPCGRFSYGRYGKTNLIEWAYSFSFDFKS